MPGFGYGSFGYALFGQFNWSRRVLYETAPEIYRTADLEQGEVFRLFAEAQGVSFDDLRLKIANFATLRHPRAVRTQYDEVRTLRLGKVEPIRLPVEQGGVLATVSALNVFTAIRSHFTTADVGKELTVYGSSIQTNNCSVVVTNIVSPTEVLTNPPLAPDAGPLRWELRPLETSTRTETLVTVLAGDVESLTPGWVLSDGYSDFTVLKRRQFKTAVDERKLLTLREGSDGSLLASSRFSSPTVALTSLDVGRKLTIARSLNPHENDGKFEIVDVLSATECVLDSLTLIAESTGDLTWALLRDPEITLEGSSLLRGTVEQAGEDGVLQTATNFIAVSGKFSTADVGKLLTVHKPGNADNGTYEVTSVVSASEVVLDATLTTFIASGVHWELRSATSVGDGTQVEAHAPDLLQYLAADFGVALDNREEKEWQQRWVESVSRWIGLKGHEDGYKYLAELTGFTAIVRALYRVSQELYLAATAAGALTYEIGEETVGRYGYDGSLNVVGGFVRFTSPTAVFENWDVGRQIAVEDTAGAVNDGLRTITTVIDAQTVEFRMVDTMTGASDVNNGTLTWRVVRLYADQAPTLPVHDEINVDLMTYLKTSAVFTVDKYCWEQSPSPWSTLIGPGDAGDGRLFITAISPTGASVFPTTYTVSGRGDFEVAVGLGTGKWRLTDSAPASYFLETVPTLRQRGSGSTGSLRHQLPFFNRRFTDNSYTFTAADIGRFILIENSAVPSNNKAFRISALVSAHAVTLHSSHTVTSDSSGTLRWTMLQPDFRGTDGALTAPRRFTTGGAVFAASDQGKRLIISESGSGNNQTFVIETFVDASNVDLAPYDTPVTPDANNGSLVWAVFSYEFTVIATEPPNIGAASLEYICPEQLSCDYCKSNKVMVEASTPYFLEKGFERLRERLAQATPKHVELIENFGIEATASLALTASVDSP